MAKTSLQLWEELQDANVSNSTGYMNEFVSSENPLRSGSHVFTDSNVAIRNSKITRMSNDSGGCNLVGLQDYRESLLSGQAKHMADLQKIVDRGGYGSEIAKSYLQGRA